MAKSRPVRIRLLVSVVGRGPVHGEPGAELTVDSAVARDWADGVRAERIIDRSTDVETTEG